MEVLILAGGFGTRLKEVVSEVPKPMAPIGDKPFLEVLLSKLPKTVSKIVFSIGYLGEIIQNHFNNEYNGIPIEYSIEKEPLGTGGGILLATNKIQNDNFIVLNGDTFFDFDLNYLHSQHLSNKSDVTLALKEMIKPHRYGTVKLKDARIVEFIEKQEIDKGIINCGVYCLNKSIFKNKNVGEKFSFEKLLEDNINKFVISGLISDSYFIDIGIPEDYEKAQFDLK